MNGREYEERIGRHAEETHKFKLSRGNVLQFLRAISSLRKQMGLNVFDELKLIDFGEALISPGPGAQQFVAQLQAHLARLNLDVSNPAILKNRIWYYFDLPPIFEGFTDRKKQLTLASMGHAISLRHRDKKTREIHRRQYDNYMLTLKRPQAGTERTTLDIELYLPGNGTGFVARDIIDNLFFSFLNIDFFSQSALPGEEYYSRDQRIINFHVPPQNRENFRSLQNTIDLIFDNAPQEVRRSLPRLHTPFFKNLEPVLEVDLVSTRFDFTGRLDREDITLQVSIDKPVNITGLHCLSGRQLETDYIASRLGDFEVEIRLQFQEMRSDLPPVAETLSWYEKVMQKLSPDTSPYLAPLEATSKYQRYVNLILNE
jgi:hypothetical protein